jgi:cyclic beta-1,2-glucan synthetase
MNGSKTTQKDILELLPNAVNALKKNIIEPLLGDGNNKKEQAKSPLRSELFTEQQLEEHAKILAKRHTQLTKTPTEALLKRLADNESILLDVQSLLTETIKKNIRIVPAAEWLLDNFYLIEEQVYTAKKHLPKGYSKGLPQLLKGASAGLPRVYDIAVELISHSDGHIDEEMLTNFINAYQTVNYLKIGELWAIPIMLRLALIENVRRLAKQISVDINHKSLSDSWADQMIDAAENDPKNLVLVIADMARSEPPIESAFVSELTRRLLEKGNALSLPLTWLEQRISETGFTTSDLVQQENQKQAADQVSISNSISSLRFLSTTDWRDFVENVSSLEKILCQDPLSIYEKMDFATRDMYRHAIEKISKKSQKTEQEIAVIAVQLASKNAGENSSRLGHVGYYLIDKGLKKTATLAGVKFSGRDKTRIVANKFPLIVYAGSIFLLSALLSWLLIYLSVKHDMNLWMLGLLALTSFIAISQFAASVVNWVATLVSNPVLLPRMNFSKGIPEKSRTMVVIPTLLSSPGSINHVLEDLEVRYIANQDNNLYFALLTDFKDAPEENMPDDKQFLNQVEEKIRDLNKKYHRADNEAFYLFHRPRLYNPKEKVWMGFERKRGKLGNLNEVLRGSGKEKFSYIIGDEKNYTAIKYIITLDSDTQLPRDAAWKLAATMSHPLNMPVYSEKKKRVTQGYSILQPRVSNSLPNSTSSAYAKMHGNEPGTDPYTRAVSDVYQDLFKEGSFIGKGIYDIDAFEKALKDRLPENRILSHDLLEGSYSRAGLVTDIQLFEEYPEAYITDMARRRRWIRGDWQIASWITPFVPGYKKTLVRNPLSHLSVWKIFDNLRRSLVPVALILLLIYGWIIADSAVLWTLAVLSILFLPVILNFLWQIIKKPSDVLFYQHLIYCWRSLRDGLLQNAIDIICLPFTVYINIAAITVTFWRVYFSRKHLLQWQPFQNKLYDQKRLKSIFIKMWFAPFFSVAAIVAMQFFFPASVIMASPILAAWFIAPFVAWAISQPGYQKNEELNNEENIYLRNVGRRIWLYFETFVTEAEHWLPPDNYQEEPVERTARRTSPTNIGLALLANVTAWDFGYITITKVVERCANTINTMQRMEKFKGHLYNWYDTETLAPLYPRYISTVDSGNLMGHLITLKQALHTLPDKKIITSQAYEGLLDTVRLLTERITIPELDALKKNLEQTYISNTEDVFKTKIYLDELEASFAEIFVLPQLQYEDEENEIWAEKIFSQIRELKNELQIFVPWIILTEAPEKFKDLLPDFPSIPTILQLSKIEQVLLQKIISCYSTENTSIENEWLNHYRAAITESGRRAKEILLRIGQLVTKCDELADMEYDFLFDKSQNLLAIGYNVEENRRDKSYYDLLASEARLTTFSAIAQGKLPQESWFALGRQLTNVGTTPILLSWSGSVFEYLMPLLVMPTYENTLLDQTNKAVVEKQIEYGRKKNVPWGISESGYNLVDAHLNWQYRAFGVPGIGFKRGLGEDLVISPYSTIMSLMVAPSQSFENLLVLKEKGFDGKYGFYESVDYTKSRLQRRQNFMIIKSFMSHHQGMSFLSLSYLLHNRPMQERFSADVQVKSALLLLQERIPRVTTFYSPTVHAGDISVTPGGDGSMRVISNPSTSIPEVQLLSNGRYDLMITNAGGGYSKWKDIALTRWREDATCDDWGTFCFIRDTENNEFWSSAYQPALQSGTSYEAVFSQGRAEFRRKDFSFETHTEIVVSPEDDIELRRIHITNKSRRKRTIEITSYAEVVLTVAKTDEVHPAFSNLFIQTAIQKNKNAIICTRRPRSANENNPCMFHLMKVNNAEIKNVTYETNRNNFIGRGNTIHRPQVMYKASNGLSDTEGSVLDPIVSIRYSIVIEPQETIVADLIFGVAETLDNCNFLIDKYQDRNLTNRILELSWTHSQVLLRQLNAIESDAQLYASLASSILFANPSLRTDPAVMIKNNRGQSGLWGYSISGDLPIVLLQIEDMANFDLVRKMVQAHTYWRFRGLAVDLVIWNEDNGGYRQVLLNQIQSLITPVTTGEAKDKPGGIFVRSAEQISNEDRILFQSVARVIISDKLGTLEEQISRRTAIKSNVPYFSPAKFYPSEETSIDQPQNLQLANGHGGFSEDGKAYIITTTAKNPTPAPWINVLANENFGSIVSESGQSYTWIENAHEFRLTPWNNDPVSDLRGEAFYLRDEESGRFWSPSPLPYRGKSLYNTIHGFGYSIFHHSEDGIESTMTMYVDIKAPVKFIVIKLRNSSSRMRRISATGYVEWVLGDLRSKSLMHIVTEVDTRSSAILARNPYNTEFESRVGFFDVDEPNRFITTDRTEFIGRNGTMANPDAMNRSKLSGKKGAGLDPCAAIQVVFDLAEEEEKEIVFRLGAGKNTDEVLKTILNFEGIAAAKTALENVHQFWEKTLGRLHLQTPDVGLNILANGWLTYQTLSSRIWARSGFYQSGGAFGYRDQLQDVLSLLLTDAAIARQQIVLSASRQFIEGDVQHWWHPPLGRGVRTTCSDDYLWLPFVTYRYVSSTGDDSLLNEIVPFLEGRLLNSGEESYYDLPIISDKKETVYQHCVRAIEHGLKFGVHGLPFIGSGDWNDGMDKVGEHGKGESVWLAFFLHYVLVNFATVAESKNDNAFAEKCKNNALKLRENINKNAWDGDWYRRAYFDDGTPLGSVTNEECKIDSIAQSWAIISGAGEKDRNIKAMDSAYKNLVRKEEKLIQLFEPPFDKGSMNPGYIKGYVPGVRENGGQYTHAAVWLIMGFATMGNNERTWELLNMINPLKHGDDADRIAEYEVEPYVIAADVYAEPLHKGRGGWTWYTGSAGWMFQMITETFVGIKKYGNKLYIEPCLPKEWPSITIVYTYFETAYTITINNGKGSKSKITSTGKVGEYVKLIDDKAEHIIIVDIVE